MASNSTEVVYGFGQMGSILVANSTTLVTVNDPAISGSSLNIPDNVVFVAMTFLADTTFNSDAEGLVAENALLFPNSNSTSLHIDLVGGATTDGIVYPRGITIYGRWTGFKLNDTSSKLIAYIGY